MTDIFDQLSKQTGGTPTRVDVPQTPESGVIGDDCNSEANPDSTYTRQAIKDACQFLLRYGLLEMASKPKLYQTVIRNQSTVEQILEPFDMRLRVDDVRGLVLLVISEVFGEASGSDSDTDTGGTEADEWSHPLVRRQRLNLEQSLLLAMLREQFVAHELEAGIGGGQCVVSLDELRHGLQVYLGDMGSESAEDRRLRNLLEKLKGHGVVTDVDQYDQVQVKPLITHLANPENLAALLAEIRRQAGGGGVDGGTEDE